MREMGAYAEGGASPPPPHDTKGSKFRQVGAFVEARAAGGTTKPADPKGSAGFVKEELVT